MKMRSYYLNQTIKYLDTEFVKVISGVRRSGKSFLLKMLKNKLDQEKIETLYLDFEHPDTFNLQTADQLYDYIKSNVNQNEKVYFLFDEIAEVTDW